MQNTMPSYTRGLEHLRILESGAGAQNQRIDCIRKTADSCLLHELRTCSLNIGLQIFNVLIQELRLHLILRKITMV
jgi:hypothetical protein